MRVARRVGRTVGPGNIPTVGVGLIGTGATVAIRRSSTVGTGVAGTLLGFSIGGGGLRVGRRVGRGVLALVGILVGAKVGKGVEVFITVGIAVDVGIGFLIWTSTVGLGNSGKGVGLGNALSGLPFLCRSFLSFFSSLKLSRLDPEKSKRFSNARRE